MLPRWSLPAGPHVDGGVRRLPRCSALIVWFVFLFPLPLVVYMPHLRSPAAAAARRLRAAERGFLKQKDGISLLPVPSPIAARAKIVVRGLHAHQQLNERTQSSHHFLGQAVLAAKDDLPHEKVRGLLSLNKRMGHANAS